MESFEAFGVAPCQDFVFVVFPVADGDDAGHRHFGSIEIACKRIKIVDAVDVVRRDRQIEIRHEAGAAGVFHGVDGVFEGAFAAAEGVVFFGVGAVEADFDGIEAGFFERFGAFFGETEAGCEHRDGRLRFVDAGDDIGDVVSHHRLAAVDRDEIGAHVKTLIDDIDDLVDGHLGIGTHHVGRAAVGAFVRTARRHADGNLIRRSFFEDG